MRERLTALRRLTAVYQMIEETHSIEARRSAASVAEAQSAIHAEETRSYEARIAGREALLTDDRTGWSLAIVREEIADQRKRLFEPILEAREKRSEEARMRYLESRLRSDRIKRLTENASARAAEERKRRTQAEADDCFLSRRRWQQRTLKTAHGDMSIS